MKTLKIGSHEYCSECEYALPEGLAEELIPKVWTCRCGIWKRENGEWVFEDNKNT